jgi:hypothetical protein
MVTYRHNPAVEASSMKSESLLFDPSSRKFCLLNETATCVWERLERWPPPASWPISSVSDSLESRGHRLRKTCSPSFDA